MKKRLLAIFMTIAMAVAFMPTMAFAAPNPLENDDVKDKEAAVQKAIKALEEAKSDAVYHQLMAGIFSLNAFLIDKAANADYAQVIKVLDQVTDVLNRVDGTINGVNDAAAEAERNFVREVYVDGDQYVDSFYYKTWDEAKDGATDKDVVRFYKNDVHKFYDEYFDELFADDEGFLTDDFQVRNTNAPETWSDTPRIIEKKTGDKWLPTGNIAQITFGENKINTFEYASENVERTDKLYLANKVAGTDVFWLLKTTDEDNGYEIANPYFVILDPVMTTDEEGNPVQDKTAMPYTKLTDEQLAMVVEAYKFHLVFELEKYFINNIGDEAELNEFFDKLDKYLTDEDTRAAVARIYDALELIYDLNEAGIFQDIIESLEKEFDVDFKIDFDKIDFDKFDFESIDFNKFFDGIDPTKVDEVMAAFNEAMKEAMTDINGQLLRAMNELNEAVEALSELTADQVLSALDDFVGYAKAIVKYNPYMTDDQIAEWMEVIDAADKMVTQVQKYKDDPQALIEDLSGVLAEQAQAVKKMWDEGAFDAYLPEGMNRAVIEDLIEDLIAYAESYANGTSFRDLQAQNEELDKLAAELQTQVDTLTSDKEALEKENKDLKEQAKGNEAYLKQLKNAQALAKAKVKITKAKSKKKVVTVKWKKPAQDVTGYKVTYKIGNKTKSKTVGANKTSYKIPKKATKKAKGKKITVQITALYKINYAGTSLTYASKASKAKKVKVK